MGVVPQKTVLIADFRETHARHRLELRGDRNKKKTVGMFFFFPIFYCSIVNEQSPSDVGGEEIKVFIHSRAAQISNGRPCRRGRIQITTVLCTVMKTSIGYLQDIYDRVAR